MLVAFVLACAVVALIPAEAVNRSAEDLRRLLGLLLGLLLLFPLALADDRWRLEPGPQFLGHLAMAAVPVAFGITIDQIAVPFGEPIALPPVVAVGVTILWTVTLINTMNLIDVTDGLAAGVALVAALTLSIRSVLFGQDAIALLPLALAGCALGFLGRNFHPAQVFMGTSGSVFLGYALANLAIIGGVKVGTAAIVLGVPLMDVAWVVLRRVWQGRSPFKGGDREHLAHRLLSLGLSQRETALLLYAACALFGALGLALHAGFLSRAEKLYLAGGMVVVVVACLAYITHKSEAQRRATSREAP